MSLVEKLEQLVANRERFSASCREQIADTKVSPITRHMVENAVKVNDNIVKHIKELIAQEKQK